MPYICSRNTANNGVLQVKDLYPNKSQHNPTQLRSFKPSYLRTPDDLTEITLSQLGGTDGTVGTAQEMRGLVAFLFMENLFVNDIEGPDFEFRLFFANNWTGFFSWITENNIDWDFNYNGEDEIGEINYFLGFLEGTEEYKQKFLSILAGAEYIVPAGTKWGNSDGEIVEELLPTQNFLKNFGEYKIVGQHWEHSFLHGELRTLIDNGQVAVYHESGVSLTGVDLP